MEDIIQTEDFVSDLSEAEFLKVIAQDNLRVKEINLFEAMISWGRYQMQLLKLQGEDKTLKSILSRLEKVLIVKH